MSLETPTKSTSVTKKPVVTPGEGQETSRNEDVKKGVRRKIKNKRIDLLSEDPKIRAQGAKRVAEQLLEIDEQLPTPPD